MQSSFVFPHHKIFKCTILCGSIYTTKGVPYGFVTRRAGTGRRVKAGMTGKQEGGNFY